MTFKFILFSILVGFTFPLLATESPEKKTLPFVVKRTVVVPVSPAMAELCPKIPNSKIRAFSNLNGVNREGTALAEKTEEQAVDVDIDKILATIREIKQNLCLAVGKGEVKFWVKSDFEGKILGIGGSAESGIEVMVQCEK